MIADALPRHYANEKQWNRQKHFSTGLSIEREGLKIETRRKKELVNHGVWKRYSVDVPEGQKLTLNVSDVILHDGGRVTFRIIAESPVRGRIELQDWRRGIRIFGISADCDAAVRLTLDAEVVLRSERGTILPTVSVAPKITKAHAELLDFRLRRVGDLRGSAAKELGDAAEPTLRHEVAEKDEKIADKLNKAIAKRSAELRVSGDDFLKEKWTELQSAIHKKSASATPPTPAVVEPAIVNPAAAPPAPASLDPANETRSSKQ
jgi:hypothetical protein